MAPATAAARAAQAAPARRAPARRPAAAPRRRTAPASARAPIVVGRRTAAAVSNLADTGLLFRLTRGRLWIGALTTLLVGIVALNVMELSFGASASNYGRESDILKRENSTLTTRLSTAFSDDSLQRTAGQDGLIQPAPGSIRYLDASAKNAGIAARRLSSGALTYGATEATTTATSLVAPPTTTTTDPTVTTTTDPTATTTTVPATTSTDPTTATTTATVTAPTTTTPATTATTTPSTTPVSGGVTAP